MTRRLSQAALALGLGSILFTTARLIVNTTFMPSDDEGYVLLTYRTFLTGGRLYDDIFTQYGPWPYVYHLLVSRVLNEPVTHAVGRTLTALHWTLCALMVGAITARLTLDNAAAACLATLLSFSLLWQMNAEPSHPGSLISIVLAAATWTAVVAHGAGRWLALGTGMGLAAALLVLTKINVGLLFVTGVGVAALRLTAWPVGWQRPAAVVATVGLLALPWGLMSHRLDEPWVLIFAIQFTVSAAGLIWTTPVASTDRRVPMWTWAVAAGAFVVALFLVCGVAWARGTSLPALVRAVLVTPLRHPAHFAMGLDWVPAVGPVACTCWLVAARAGFERRRYGEVERFTRLALVGLRLAAMLALIFSTATWLTPRGVNGFLIFCLPLLPVFLVPLRSSRSAGPGPSDSLRLWVACLVLPQVLHAFPVAGSQIGWGTFLVLPVMVAAVPETWQAVASSFPRLGSGLPRAGWRPLLLVGLTQLALLLHTGWQRYRAAEPLGLPGAENLRFDGPTRLALRILTLNAAMQADVLFSRPGMFSFNLWSGVPTPTTQNATHWFWLLDAEAQAAIIDRLRRAPGSAVITNQSLDDFLDGIHVPTKGRLQSFILEHYHPLLTQGDFRFLVPRGSRAAPLGKIEVSVSGTETTVGPPALLQTLVVLDGLPAFVRLREVRAPWSVRAEYTPRNVHTVLEPITLQGEAAGQAIELPTVEPVRGLFRLTVRGGEPPDPAKRPDLELVVLDPTGAVLSESAF